MNRTVICIVMLVAAVFSLAFCDSVDAAAAGLEIVTENDGTVVVGDLALMPEGEAARVYENEGLKLLVPLEYDDLVLIETPLEDPDGTLFTAAEKASIEAAGGQDGAGALFSICRIDEEQMRRMRCYDMSGSEIFAADLNGNYYVFRHPTDVRFVRENYEDIDADMQQWTELNEWAWNSVRSTFTETNEGLTEARFGNSELEIYLARICWMDETGYTLSTTEFGPKEPADVDPCPFAEKLMNGVVYETLDTEEAPDGEYVVLNLPESGYRFDFFLMEGKENLIRQVWGDGNELLYRADFDDETVKAADVMRDWYDTLVADETMRELGYTPDALLGVWTEKMAGRGEITISRAEEPETYSVEIRWPGSAVESCYWTMTAHVAGCNCIRYENGTMATVIVDENGNDHMTTDYTDGTGSFSLLSTNELVWQDNTGHAGDDAVFVSAG